jgi:outer membrane protein
LRNVEQQVLLEAVTAYADVLRDQALVRLREKAVDVLTRDLAAVEARRNVREVTRTDVAQAQYRRARAVSQLDLARANLKTSRAVYERAIGRPAHGLSEPTLPTRLIPMNVEDVLRIGEREHPNVVSALYRERSARHGVDKIWGELLPEVRLEASHGQRFDSDRVTNESEQTRIGGRVSVPLYEGGETQARVRAAKHQHIARLQEIEQARAETQALAVTAWSRLQAVRAQSKTDRIGVESARVALEGVREEERVGQRTLLDVLNAEQELLDAEVQQVATRREIIVATFGLLGAIGRLNADELKLTDSAYDPDVHYEEVERKWWGVSITHANGKTELIDTLDNWGAGDSYDTPGGLPYGLRR